MRRGDPAFFTLLNAVLGFDTFFWLSNFVVFFFFFFAVEVGIVFVLFSLRFVRRGNVTLS